MQQAIAADRRPHTDLSDPFVRRHIGPGESEIREMLSALGMNVPEPVGSSVTMKSRSSMRIVPLYPPSIFTRTVRSGGRRPGAAQKRGSGPPVSARGPKNTPRPTTTPGAATTPARP